MKGFQNPLDMSEGTDKPRRDAYLIVGAPLLMVNGILCFINGIQALLGTSNSLSFLSSAEATVYPVCVALLFVFGAISITAGVYALTQNPHLMPILAGTAAGILGGGLIGFFVGFAAIFLFWKANVDL